MPAWLLALTLLASAHEGADARLLRLDAALEQRPADDALRVDRAEALLQAGRPLQALDALPAGSREADQVRVEVLARLERWPEVEAAASRYLEAGPPHAGVLDLRARARASLDRPREALADRDAAVAVRATPDRALARGRLAEALGEGDRAAAGYAEALEALPGAVAVHLARIDLLRRRDPAAALQATDGLLALSPDHPDWLLLRAGILAELDRPRAAQATRDRALQVIEMRLVRRDTAQLRRLRARALAAP